MTGPYDRFFRYTFSAPARAEVLLRHNLPASLVAAVDWSTLRRESGTFVDWERETRKDLLFSARYRGAPAQMPPHFFPIEHQSKVYRWMALRVHDYCGRLVRSWHEVHPRSPWIPEVTPLVVYPRRERKWSAPLRLEDLYPMPAWATDGRQHARWGLSLEYLLDGLSQQSERVLLALPGPPLVPLNLLVLRYAGTKRLAERLPHWGDLFARVHASTYGTQVLYRVARYLLNLSDEPAYEALRGVLRSILASHQAEAFMRTMAEILKERGRQLGLAQGVAQGVAKGLAEGEAKGEAKGLARAVLRLLAARGLHVDDHSRHRIQSCMDVAVLERWLERAMSATRLSEVLDEPV